MAVTTQRVTITESYTLVASAGAWTSIQVTGIQQVDVFIQASGGAAPTTELGFILRVLDAMTPDTFGDGDIYIKTRQALPNSSVAILTV